MQHLQREQTGLDVLSLIYADTTLLWSGLLERDDLLNKENLARQNVCKVASQITETFGWGVNYCTLGHFTQIGSPLIAHGVQLLNWSTDTWLHSIWDGLLNRLQP